MPFYQNVFTCKWRTPPEQLTRLYRRLCNTVLEDGGMVRCVENHGVKDLAYRFRARTAMSGSENRYHTRGRWVSMYFDARPETLDKIDADLKLQDFYLRSTTIKPVVKMNWISTRHKTNPWERDATDPLPFYMVPSNSLAYRPGEAPSAAAYADSVTDASGFRHAGYVRMASEYENREKVEIPSEAKLGRPPAPTDYDQESPEYIYSGKLTKTPQDLRPPGSPRERASLFSADSSSADRWLPSRDRSYSDSESGSEYPSKYESGDESESRLEYHSKYDQEDPYPDLDPGGNPWEDAPSGEEGFESDGGDSRDNK